MFSEWLKQNARPQYDIEREILRAKCFTRQRTALLLRIKLHINMRQTGSFIILYDEKIWLAFCAIWCRAFQRILGAASNLVDERERHPHSWDTWIVSRVEGKQPGEETRVANLKFYIIKKRIEECTRSRGRILYYNALPSVTHSVGKVLPAIPKRKLMHFFLPNAHHKLFLVY